MAGRYDLEHAVAAVEPGGRLVGVHELTGGVSAEVLALDIATAAGARRRVVYRRHRSPDFKQHGRSVATKEYDLLAALHGRGLPVPQPLLVVVDDEAGSPYLVMEWVDGSTAVASADLAPALDQMAAFLAALHSIDPTGAALPQLAPIEDPLAAMADLLPTTVAGEQVRTLLAAAALGYEPCEQVLVHCDYWPGNVLWRNGELVAVVDWEDACAGDPLADLATPRVELWCEFGARAMARFTASYLAMASAAVGSPRPGSLIVWDLYVSAAALSAMGQWGLAPEQEARRRRRTQGFFERAVRDLRRHLRR